MSATALTFGIDIDATVADLHTEWLRRYNHDYGDSLTPDRIVGWNVHAFVRPECGEKIYDYLHDGGMYEHVTPIPGAVEVIAGLKQRGHRVIFISSCVPGSADAKAHWLVRHGFLSARSVVHNFMACHDKWLVRADVLIDDRSDTVDKVPGLGVLYDQPWNQHNGSALRLRSWYQFPELYPEILHRCGDMVPV